MLQMTPVKSFFLVLVSSSLLFGFRKILLLLSLGSFLVSPASSSEGILVLKPGKTVT